MYITVPGKELKARCCMNGLRWFIKITDASVIIHRKLVVDNIKNLNDFLLRWNRYGWIYHRYGFVYSDSII